MKAVILVVYDRVREHDEQTGTNRTAVYFVPAGPGLQKMIHRHAPREMKRPHPRSCARHARTQEPSRGYGGAPRSRRGWVNNNGEVVSIFNSFCHAYVDMHVVFFPRMYCMVYIAPSSVGGIYFVRGWAVLER